MAATAKAASFRQPTQPNPATAIATWVAMTLAPTIRAPGTTVEAAVAAETTGASRARRTHLFLKNSPFGRLSKAPFLLRCFAALHYLVPRHCGSDRVVQCLHAERNVLNHAVEKESRRGA